MYFLICVSSTTDFDFKFFLEFILPVLIDKAWSQNTIGILENDSVIDDWIPFLKVGIMSD